jgi:hypothetical protein
MNHDTSRFMPALKRSPIHSLPQAGTVQSRADGEASICRRRDLGVAQPFHVLEPHHRSVEVLQPIQCLGQHRAELCTWAASRRAAH